MAKRKHIPTATMTDLLVACRRRCCLCYFLDFVVEDCRGQIAHINKDPGDNRPDNLVYLCLDHHDRFDSTTRLSKGFTAHEVRTHRDRLVQVMRELPQPPAAAFAAAAEEMAVEIDREDDDGGRGWRFPLWLIANRPEIFAYHAPGADGVCAIERIDLPDGRVAISCIEIPGNPGKSVTNAAEHIFEQLCERFDFDPARIIWLEHYEDTDDEEWRLVRFDQASGSTPAPSWTVMTPALWRSLGLSPVEKSIFAQGHGLGSKIEKHFPWPPYEPNLGGD